MTPPKSAIIVVDFQEDFCPPNGPLAVPSARTLAPLINSLLALPTWTLRIATQDWHPRTHISFASNHPPPNNTPFTSTTTVSNPLNPAEKIEIPLWPDHCIQDTPGAALIPELDASRFDCVVEKGKDERVEMFSAFSDGFREPTVSESELEGVLREKGVEDVYVVALATDFCVKHTAIAAKERGFRTWIVRDAVKGIEQSEDGMRRLKEEFEKAGVEWCDSGEVRRRLEG